MKKLVKIIILCLSILAIHPQGVLAKTENTSVINGKRELVFDSKIEKPSTEIIKGKTQVKGWFVYGNPIVKIEIFVDDQYVGTASRSSRTDLKKTHPDYDLSKAGYSYMLDTTKLTNGKHQIGVMAYLENGQRELDWKDVFVSNPPSANSDLGYMSCIDTPTTDGEEVLSGKVDISGWYLYGKPINTIQIYVDNKYMGIAKRYARTDIAEGRSDYDFSKSGFSYTLDTDKLGKGMHLVEIRAKGSDGTVDKREFNINLGKVELGFDSKIEKPNADVIKGKTQVKGWFVYGEPIVKIEIFVDDQYVGTASRSSRTDLKKTHPDYDLSKAGYSYMLDTTKLTNGKHQIGVMAYLENGQREIDWKDVTVKN